MVACCSTLLSPLPHGLSLSHSCTLYSGHLHLCIHLLTRGVGMMTQLVDMFLHRCHTGVISYRDMLLGELTFFPYCSRRVGLYGQLDCRSHLLGCHQAVHKVPGLLLQGGKNGGAPGEMSLHPSFWSMHLCIHLSPRGVGMMVTQVPRQNRA